MAISLYDASVSSFLQTLDAMVGVLDKGLAFAKDKGLDPEEIVEARIFPDMSPFRFQIMQTAFHSVGAWEAIKTGALTLPGQRPPLDYAGLQTLIAEAAQTLRALTPEEVNARDGAEVVLDFPGRPRRVFTAAGYLLSFSLPNFYFHATTAYDILRGKGAPVGKMDFMGAMRLKD